MAAPPTVTNGQHTTPTSSHPPSLTNGSNASALPAWVNPDLSALLTVHHAPSPASKSFSSYSTSLVALPAGALFARLTGLTPTTQSYSSVQASRTLHIELNSALLYIDHSCAPSLEFDMARFEVRVARNRPLREGDKLTFFYPSTEWAMAQPFECRCGSDGCLGTIRGAGEMGRGVLGQYWLNGFVEEMLGEGEGGRGQM
ncbi:hypothetical protein MMC26_005551 [Xylographa opegraphella]|nr:hypothetical protein [Xylographa opegraphella]